MLRKVCFGNSQLDLKVRSRPVSLAEQIKHPQPRGICERFANSRLPFKDLRLQRRRVSIRLLSQSDRPTISTTKGNHNRASPPSRLSCKLVLWFKRAQ